MLYLLDLNPGVALQIKKELIINITEELSRWVDCGWVLKKKVKHTWSFYKDNYGTSLVRSGHINFAKMNYFNIFDPLWNFWDSLPALKYSSTHYCIYFHCRYQNYVITWLK